MVHAVVELAIVVELVLPVNLATLLGETKYLLLDLHEFHHYVPSLTHIFHALLTHGRVERRQNY